MSAIILEILLWEKGQNRFLQFFLWSDEIKAHTCGGSTQFLTNSTSIMINSTRCQILANLSIICVCRCIRREINSSEHLNMFFICPSDCSFEFLMKYEFFSHYKFFSDILILSQTVITSFSFSEPLSFCFTSAF